MAELTLAQTKAYLRVQHDAEDTLITALMASAIGVIEAFLQRPIYNRPDTRMIYIHGDVFRHGAKVLFLPFYPLASVTSITYEDDTVIPLADLLIDLRSGTVSYKDNGRFSFGRYTVVTTGGLEALPEFQSLVEPIMNQAVLDTVADLYQRRNPAAGAEREGGGVSVEYAGNTRSGVADNFREDGLISRVAYSIAPWRLLGAVT